MSIYVWPNRSESVWVCVVMHIFLASTENICLWKCLRETISGWFRRIQKKISWKTKNRALHHFYTFFRLAFIESVCILFLGHFLELHLFHATFSACITNALCCYTLGFFFCMYSFEYLYTLKCMCLRKRKKFNAFIYAYKALFYSQSVIFFLHSHWERKKLKLGFPPALSSFDRCFTCDSFFPLPSTVYNTFFFARWV